MWRDFFGAPIIVATIIYLIWQGPRTRWVFPWQRFRNGLANIGIFLINFCIKLILFTTTAIFSIKAFGAYLPQLPDGFWNGWPLVVQVIIVCAATDFSNYWAHRILHTKYFWGIHAVHHSDDDITWTTSLRVHFLELVVMGINFFFLIGWLNFTPEAIAFAAPILVWYNYYIHCQLGFTHGPARKIIVSPNYHRWHHTDEPKAYNKNFADVLPLWDILFGTRYDPGVSTGKLGVPGVPKGVTDSLFYPFHYWAMLWRERGSQNRDRIDENSS